MRKAKTEAKVSLRTEVDEAVVRDTAGRIAALEQAEAELRGAGRIRELRLEPGDGFAVEVVLAAQGQPAG